MISGPVSAILSDVDGVLTSNHLNFSEEHLGKTFHVHDGHGVVLLRKAGIFCALVTGRDDVAMQRRADALKIDWHFAHADRPKGAIVRDLLAQNSLDAAETVFVGDDVTDISAFAEVGWPVAVSDALPEVRRAARRVTTRPGGRGAFREVVDWVLSSR